MCYKCQCRKPPCIDPPFNSNGTECDLDCDDGYKVEEDNDCPICECASENPCPSSFDCDLAWEYGYDVDKYGCEICECRVNKENFHERRRFLIDCDKYECTEKECQYGYLLDERGCLTDDCKCAYENSTKILINELQSLFSGSAFDYSWHWYLTSIANCSNSCFAIIVYNNLSCSKKKIQKYSK